MDDIDDLIDEGILELSGGSINCHNCDEPSPIYVHKYDPNISAYQCGTCKNCEWVNDTGTKNNPRLCPYCKEYVTNEEVEAGKSIQCSAHDAREDRCEQLAHKECVDMCEQCGWFCEMHQSDYFECDHCGRYHENEHIVSLSKDFQEAWGFICETCFKGDGYDDSFLQEHVQAEEAELKRTDCSKYLHHFVGKGATSESDNLEKIISILKSKYIEASDTGYYSVYSPDGNASKSVCFTEARLTALFDHIKRFGYFGLAFSKTWLHKTHFAAPAIYIHGDIIQGVRDDIPSKLKPYVNKISFGDYDYHFEREWRVPKDVTFELKDVRFVFAPLQHHNTIREETGYNGQMICLEKIMVL